MRWFVLHILRRVGIAIGWFVAASLVVGFVAFRPLDPGSTFIGSTIAGLVTLVLGFLIFRDILRREQPSL